MAARTRGAGDRAKEDGRWSGSLARIALTSSTRYRCVLSPARLRPRWIRPSLRRGLDRLQATDRSSTLDSAEDTKDNVVESEFGPEKEATLASPAGDGDEGPGARDSRVLTRSRNPHILLRIIQRIKKIAKPEGFRCGSRPSRYGFGGKAKGEVRRRQKGDT